MASALHFAAPPAGFEPATQGLGISPDVCRRAQRAQRALVRALRWRRESVLHTRFRCRDGNWMGKFAGPGPPARCYEVTLGALGLGTVRRTRCAWIAHPGGATSG